MPIRSFFAHLLITAALLLLVARLVKGVKVEGWGPAFIGALVLGLANAIVKPVMVVLTLPLTILTLGLFLLVINALMLRLVSALVPGIKVQGCGTALWGGLVLGAAEPGGGGGDRRARAVGTGPVQPVQLADAFQLGPPACRRAPLSYWPTRRGTVNHSTTRRAAAVIASGPA
ncbi:MAG: phage holin family protein [bacterium]|nr:phage holin family protein [bacterium]